MAESIDKDAVRAAFIKAGLSRLLKDIDLLARATIRLYTTAVAESSLPIGVSKLDGVSSSEIMTSPGCNVLPHLHCSRQRADFRRVPSALQAR